MKSCLDFNDIYIEIKEVQGYLGGKMQVRPARLDPTISAKIRPTLPKEVEPLSSNPLTSIPKSGSGVSFLSEIKCFWLKVKTFFLDLIASWFKGKSAPLPQKAQPEISAAIMPQSTPVESPALTVKQPFPLPKETEVSSRGIISLPDNIAAVRKQKHEIQSAVNGINRIMRRLEDCAQTRGSLLGLKIASFFEKNKIIINIEQLRDEIDQVSAQLNTQNTPKFFSKMLSMVHKSLLVVEKRIGKQKDPPKPTAKTTEELLPKPMPIILSPARIFEPPPSDFAPERVEVTTTFETPLTPEEMERMRFEQSSIGKQTENISAKLKTYFPRLANPFKEALLKLFRYHILDIESSLGRLKRELTELEARKINEYEVFGVVHEIIRLGTLAESREGKDRLTGIGQILGEITFYLPEIIEETPGNFHINGGRRKAVHTLEADGYCRKTGTLIEIKYCENLRWFRDGSVSAAEKDQVFRIVSQFRKYKKALDDGTIRAVEFHFTASSLHPAAMKVIKEIFQTQLSKLKIYLYPNNITANISSEAQLVYDGAKVSAMRQVA